MLFHHNKSLSGTYAPANKLDDSMICSDFEFKRVETKFHGNAHAHHRSSSVQREVAFLHQRGSITRAKTFIFSLPL